MSDSYFDSTSLSQMRMVERRCPVRECDTPPLREGEGSAEFCKDHGLYLHSKTFRYDRPTRNILFDKDYFNKYVLRNPLKAESHRFDHENSEDAVTWNVFSCLARNRCLAGLLSDLSGRRIDGEPELYLWGLRIDLDSAAAPEQFTTLDSARQIFERGIRRMHTEPDIMLHAPGQALMLIEAKFISKNTLAEGSPNNDEEGEKPRSAQGILRRYSAGKLPASTLEVPPTTSPFYSQLYRNLVFAIWMANNLGVDWRLVNLVSRQQAHLRNDPDPTPFMHSVLPAASRQRFRRYTWEELYSQHVATVVELAALDRYMRYKSANCAQAFDIC